MSEVAQNGLNFPEGLDEAKLDELLQSLLDGVDRERLFQDESLTRVRHPLLEERMGKDVPLNVEIFNMLTDVVHALTISNKISNKDQLIALAEDIETTLLQNAKDPELFEAKLIELKVAVNHLLELNEGEKSGDDVNNLIGGRLRKKLTMPSLAQDMVLYPAVTFDSMGGPKDAVLGTLANCKNGILAALKGKDDDRSKTLREQVEAEAAAVLAWLEKSVEA